MGLLPRPFPLPLRAPPARCMGCRMVACFSSTRSWNAGSQNTHPVCCVSPSGNGERVLLKSTMTREASQESQLSWDTCTLWACSKKCTTTLHLLQAIRHFGPEVGSKTKTPVSHSTHWPMPRELRECWQEGCVHSLQPIPDPNRKRNHIIRTVLPVGEVLRAFFSCFSKC